MAMDMSYHDDGPIKPEDLKERRRWFMRAERGRTDDPYDRLANEFRDAVERISDDAELAKFIADMKLTSRDVEMMLACLAVQGRYFVALNRLAEAYLNTLNLPHQPFPMGGQLLFHDPRDVEAGIAGFAEHGVKVRLRPDLVDECGPTVFADFFAVSDLGADGFFDRLKGLADALGAEVTEAGYAEDEPLPGVAGSAESRRPDEGANGDVDANAGRDRGISCAGFGRRHTLGLGNLMRREDYNGSRNRLRRRQGGADHRKAARAWPHDRRDH